MAENMTDVSTQVVTNSGDELSGRVLLFYIGETLYGIPLTHVIEIINVQSSTHLPGVAPYIKGVINLRGKVVPVIDVRLKFHLEERPYDDKTCTIVVDIHDMHVGLIVDSVSEVITIDASCMATPPDGEGSGERYLASVSEINGRIVLNIDCERFFQSDLGFSSI